MAGVMSGVTAPTNRYVRGYSDYVRGLQHQPCCQGQYNVEKERKKEKEEEEKEKEETKRYRELGVERHPPERRSDHVHLLSLARGLHSAQIISQIWTWRWSHFRDFGG